MKKKNYIFDCDIHQTYVSHKELLKYVAGPYKSRLLESGFGYPSGLYYSSVGGTRKDAIPKNGIPGSNHSLIVKQHLNKCCIERGILNGGAMLGINLMTETDYPACLASAYNKWLINSWLNKDKRYFGSLMIASQNAKESVKEIKKLGSHPKILQVLLSAVTPNPIGQLYYEPILKICNDMSLPLAFHPGGNQASGTAPTPTPVGFPKYYLEWHTLLPTVYMAQLASLITEGAFEKFPKLKVVFIEGGVSWVLPFMWRMDKNYKALRRQTPWLKKLPSQYIKENCFFTTQPKEEPSRSKDLETVYVMAGLTDNIFYSSDYPHWDYDTPQTATLGLSEDLKNKILFKNANKFYKFNK